MFGSESMRVAWSVLRDLRAMSLFLSDMLEVSSEAGRGLYFACVHPRELNGLEDSVCGINSRVCRFWIWCGASVSTLSEWTKIAKNRQPRQNLRGRSRGGILSTLNLVVISLPIPNFKWNKLDRTHVKAEPI